MKNDQCSNPFEQNMPIKVIKTHMSQDIVSSDTMLHPQKVTSKHHSKMFKSYQVLNKKHYSKSVNTPQPPLDHLKSLSGITLSSAYNTQNPLDLNVFTSALYLLRLFPDFIKSLPHFSFINTRKILLSNIFNNNKTLIQ